MIKKIDKDTLKKIVTECVSRILYENDGFGYHAGDLGKSEHFVNFATSNRGTGHFGTGTYFVGDEGKLNGYNYKDRPHHKIDFSPYNLVKIRSFDLGIQFHDALKYINNDAFKDYVYKGDVDHEKLKKKCQVIAVMLFDIDDFSDLFKKRDIVYNKALELIKEYADYFNENGGTIHGLAKSDRRTISTELISSFGYDGVDCRGVEGLDNTTFGSVIYNLK